MKKCPECGRYMNPCIKYQYGMAWTEYYCNWCMQKPIFQQIICTTTTNYDEVEKYSHPYNFNK